MFHIYGLQVLLNLYLSAGATLVMMGRFDMGEFLGLLVKHRITWLYTVPPVGQGLTMVPGIKDLDLSALKCVFLAAAPTSADLQTRLSEAMGVPVIQGYGMTELSPASHVDYTNSSLNRSGAERQTPSRGSPRRTFPQKTPRPRGGRPRRQCRRKRAPSRSPIFLERRKE